MELNYVMSSSESQSSKTWKKELELGMDSKGMVEISDLPSLSKTENDSSTPSIDEIKKIFQFNQIINRQVQLRLDRFMQNSNLIHQSSLSKSIEKIKNSFPIIEKNFENNIIINNEYLNHIKYQHDFLINLISQLDLLQKEVESQYEIINFKSNQNKVTKENQNEITQMKIETLEEHSKCLCCEIY